MTREEYFQAIHKLHEPLRKQQIRTNAIGEKYGASSREYKIECKKEAQITCSLILPEWELWCGLCSTIYLEMVAQGKKDFALKSIIDMGKNMEEDSKPAWRKLYQQIKSA
jgi:hypothetical protein